MRLIVDLFMFSLALIAVFVAFYLYIYPFYLL